MVICKKCGADNPLGRVFCSSCGTHLDLRNMSSAMVTAKQKTPWLRILLPKAVTLLVILLLAPIALAVWPQLTPIGKKGTRIGGQRVVGALQMLMYAGRTRPVTQQLAEEDVNGYFASFKAKKLNAESVSIRVAQGYFVARVVRIVGPWTIGSLQLRPRVSYDLICVPVGDRIGISGAAIGHLKWTGPFRDSVVGRIYRMVSSEQEWRIFADLSELRAEPGKLSITVKKK